MQTPTVDFFNSTYGLMNWRRRFSGARDVFFDARLWLNPSYGRMLRNARSHPRRNILITGVQVPSRAADLQNVINALLRTRHHVTVKMASLGEGLGKFQNINRALSDVAVEDYDWLIVTDDDIAFAEGFLDNFIYLAERADLHICMPAHKFRSYQSLALTARHWGSLARVTHFVECGPITAFRRSAFPHVLPFPELRWAWGTDIAWSETAGIHGLDIGILDAVPIRHLRPVAASYNGQLAIDEATEYLSRTRFTLPRHTILRTIRTISGI